MEEWRRGKWMWRVARWSAGMYCGIVHHVLYCVITSCLSESEIRGVVQPAHNICLIFSEGSLCLKLHDITNNWGKSQGEIQSCWRQFSGLDQVRAHGTQIWCRPLRCCYVICLFPFFTDSLWTSSSSLHFGSYLTWSVSLYFYLHLFVSVVS